MDDIIEIRRKRHEEYENAKRTEELKKIAEEEEAARLLKKEQYALEIAHEREKKAFVEKYVLKYLNRNKQSILSLSELEQNAVIRFYDESYNIDNDTCNMSTVTDSFIEDDYAMSRRLIEEQDAEYARALEEDLRNNIFNNGS